MEKITQVIKTLFNLQAHINLSVESLNEIYNNSEIFKGKYLENFYQEKMPLEVSLHTLISNYTIIQFCSFLEEYNEYFNPDFCEAKYKNRILEVRKKNSAGIKRINKWKDLIKFRNELVAHNLRIKNESFFSNQIENLEYKIPNSISEKNLFSGIVYIINSNIRDEFIDVILTFNPFESMLDKMKIISEVVDNEKELEELANKMFN
ncbi:hypothetical protein SDC9_01149 [bioreactor metagenome]|uniref:HEPN AbiU2-like domain-containing protein n=1 Tax=bioreactor metagenome TaxID=1076179 RepID=A0A644SLW5_9ZZZZ